MSQLDDSKIRNYIFLIISNKNSKLSIKTSLLCQNNDTFLGLFTNQFISQNEVICDYLGEIKSTKEALKVVDKSYLMRLGENIYIDSFNCPFVLGRYINDCINKTGYNAVFDKNPVNKICKVIATRDIYPNEEIYVSYGRWYWLSKNPIRLSFKQLYESKTSCMNNYRNINIVKA